jgi:hypothetical protein
MTTAVVDPVDTPRRGVPGLAALNRIGRYNVLTLAGRPADPLQQPQGQPH